MSVTAAPLVIAMLGLGEAGSALARDLIDADTRAARDIARSAAPALTPQRIYADLHPTTSALKRERATLVEPTGALFADSAFIAPASGYMTPHRSAVTQMNRSSHDSIRAPDSTPSDVSSHESRVTPEAGYDNWPTPLHVTLD